MKMGIPALAARGFSFRITNFRRFVNETVAMEIGSRAVRRHVFRRRRRRKKKVAAAGADGGGGGTARPSAIIAKLQILIKAVRMG